MLHSTRRSSVRLASVSIACGLLLTALTADTAIARKVPAPPGAKSAAAARKATKRALAKAHPVRSMGHTARRGRASTRVNTASCWRDRYKSWAVDCPNWRAPIYKGGGSYATIDTMLTTVSWFVCQAKGGANPPFGIGRNHWWLWTQGDVYKRWGWFPANAIKIGGQEQPIPGVRGCY